jgi:hypothetical protein
MKENRLHATAKELMEEKKVCEKAKNMRDGPGVAK